MPTYIQKLLKALKQGLIHLYGERLKGLYLYGSYRRGDFQEGSDLDVLVVLDDFERAPAELKRTYDLTGNLCHSPEGTPLRDGVLREGDILLDFIQLYAEYPPSNTLNGKHLPGAGRALRRKIGVCPCVVRSPRFLCD